MILTSADCSFILFEPEHDEVNKVICVPTEDSDQPWHPPSDQSLHYALNGQKRTQGVFMQTAKTDQTVWMPRLIRVFAGRTGHFVGFAMLWLIFISEYKFLNNLKNNFKGYFP